MFAERAWVGGRWAERVVFEVDAAGDWSRIEAGVARPPESATVLPGPVLPGLVDAHSHAFQRAFAGLAERLEPGHARDDFWSWRERMYAVALRVDEDALRAVAAQLYCELLEGGYTHVCEFHYLQHRPDGTPYDDPLALAWAHADAAEAAGIGITIVPVVYERGGFADEPLGAAQRRFALGASGAWHAASRIGAARRPLLDAGVGVHSLRAARPASIADLASLAGGSGLPIHVHAAEQVREVEQCIAATGKRPIEWLLAEPGLLDARWHLVHATQATAAEIDGVAASGAGVVLCPSTEGNLGDGLTDLGHWLAAGVPLAIGSDSHIGRDALEELRWLEYGQRLAARRRVVAAGSGGGADEGAGGAAAAVLFERAVAGGAHAIGRAGRCGLVVGARADFLVADAAASSLIGIPAERLLDALVFSTPTPRWREVWVAGRRVVVAGRHVDAAAVGERFRTAMAELWE